MSFAVAGSGRRPTASQAVSQTISQPSRGSGYPQDGESPQRRQDRGSRDLPWAEYNQDRRRAVWSGHDHLSGISEFQELLPGMSTPRDVSGIDGIQSPASGSQASPRGNRTPRVTNPFYAGSPISYSAARALLPFLAKWVGGVCRQPLNEKNLAGKLRNGLILCELVEYLVPNMKPLDKPYTGQGLHPKPVAKKAILSNLERALCIAWKRGVHSFNMCSSEDFMNEHVPKTSRCLAELFMALQMRDILPRVKENMLGMHAVLAQLGRPLLEPTLHDPVGYGQHVVADFADCTRVMTLLTAFGYAEVEDLAKLHGIPQVPEQWRENQIIANDLLTKIGCPVLLFPHEWASPPGCNACTRRWTEGTPSCCSAGNAYETIIFQLDVLWRGLNGSDWPGLLNTLKKFRRPQLQNFVFKDGAPLELSQEHLQQTAVNLTEISGSPGSMKDRRLDSPDRETFSKVGDGVTWLKNRKIFLQTIGKAQPEDTHSHPTPQFRSGLWQDGDDPEDLLFLQEFKLLLLQKFRKLDVAWSKFDLHKNGLITFDEFERGCKAMDYVGNTQKLFQHLDVYDNHRVGQVEFLALTDLPASPEKGQSSIWREGDREEDLEILRQFVDKLMTKFGSWDKAWKFMDVSKNGAVSQIELSLVASEIKFHGDHRRVFALMDHRKGDGSKGTITRGEFDSLQEIYDGCEVDMGHDDVIKLWQEGDPVENLILLREFAAALRAAGLSSATEAFDQFDVMGTGRLSITALHHGARQIHFTGDTQKLFVLLDINKNGLVGRQEFFGLDRLASMPSAGMSHRPQWRPSPRHKQFAKKKEFELLVDFPTDADDSDSEWPVEVVAPVTMEEGEARFPGSAEERAWLLEEDARRLSRLQEFGSAPAARKVQSAMQEAATAAEMVADEEDMQDADASTYLSKLQGTTSIDARVVMPDGTQQRVFIQTAVVDSTGTGSSAADDAVLVLEVRDRRSLRLGTGLDKLRGHLDVGKIIAVSQLGSASALGQDGDLHFSVTAQPIANLGGAEAQAEAQACNQDEDGAEVPLEARPNLDDVLHWDERQEFQVLYVIAGPSAWRRREAIRFFDELRILQHFVADDGPISSAATSIGAAAGAAASGMSSTSSIDGFFGKT